MFGTLLLQVSSFKRNTSLCFCRSSIEDDSQVDLGPLKSVQELEKAKESEKSKAKGKDKEKKKETEPTGPFLYKFSHWAR